MGRDCGQYYVLYYHVNFVPEFSILIRKSQLGFSIVNLQNLYCSQTLQGLAIDRRQNICHIFCSCIHNTSEVNRHQFKILYLMTLYVEDVDAQRDEVLFCQQN